MQAVDGSSELLLCIQNLSTNRETCDVQFTFAARHDVFAHANILSCRSKVFQAMFFGSFVKPIDPVPKIHPCIQYQIEITDISKPIFENFINYLYGHSLQLTLDNVFEVHYTATKYDISSLVSQCCSFIKTQLEVENVLTVLSIAIAWNEPEIMESCLELIELNAPVVFKQTAFLKLHKSEVISILNRELLITETDVFLRVEDWLRHNINNEARTNESITAENIRWILYGENNNEFIPPVSANIIDTTQQRNPGFYGDHPVSKEILQYVRFGLMTAEELVKYVKHSPFVSKDTYILALEQSVVPQLVGYKSKPRIPPVSFAIGCWVQTYPGWRLVSNLQELLDNFGAFVETFSAHGGLPILSEFEIVAWGMRLADGSPIKYMDAELSVATAKKEFKASGKITGSVAKISDGLSAWKSVNYDMKGNFGGKPKVVGAKDRPGLFISLKRSARIRLSDPKNDSVVFSPKQ